MGRLIQLTVLVVLGVILYRYVQRKITHTGISRKNNPVKTEKLVQCHECGIRLPETDAIRKKDAFYCPAHRGRG